MAFRNKCQQLLAYDADFMIIQECEHPEKLKRPDLLMDQYDCEWHGENVHKGIALFYKKEYEAHINSLYTSACKYIIPLSISGPQNLNMFITWAMPDKQKATDGYVGQIWKALHIYDQIIDDKTILAGDLNSNVQWDYMRKSGNHTDVVNRLSNKNIYSIYHLLNGVKHGSENDPTLYLLKKKNRPYHIDFCFASRDLINSKTQIQIGQYEDWISLSDHMPLIVDYLGH